MEELTTIQVTKADALEIKRRFPQLRNDAVRISALLGRFEIVNVETTLPADAEEGAQPVTVITVAAEK